MITGPDLFHYYIRSVSELLSGDGFSPSSLKNTRLAGVGNGSFRDKEVAKEGSDKNHPVNIGSLFSNAIGDGLSCHEKTRLMTMLNQSVVALNREVDEMLDPVFSMHRLRALMAPTKKCATNQDANGKVEIENHARKRLKVSSLSSPGIVEVSANKGMVMTETGKSLPNNNRCANSTPLSNTDESKSLCGDCSKQVNNKSFLRSSSRDDKENGEVNDDLQVLLVNRGPVVEKMEKHSAELSAMLSRMEEKLEELLNAVISSCRPMTLAEKHQLRKLIEKLPPQNLDRVVDIIQCGKPPKKKSDHDITVDLLQEDDLTLWRIHFYVKAVESAQKLL